MDSTASSIVKIKEAAQYLGVSESNLYVLARTGKVPARKVGAGWRFNLVQLERFISGVIDSDSRCVTEIRDAERTAV